MKAVLLLFIAWWIAAGVGRFILNRFRCLQDFPLERFTYAWALGLGIAAYGVFLSGLLGWLFFWPVTLWWLLLASVGAAAMSANARDLRHWVAATLQRRPKITFLSLLIPLLLLLSAGIVVLSCFRPPGGHEWDALAYHLADPKVYLQHHRISVLPTEHHSNFPFTMEMLFTAGLLYDGFALANLFHFLTALLTVLAILAFCRRVLSAEAGYIAALLFVTTPLVLWESSVAYIDIGLGLYVTLALFAGVSLIDTRRRSCDQQETSENESSASEPNGFPTGVSGWSFLSGSMMGFALGIKYLALLPLVFLVLLLLVRRVPLRYIGIYVGLALLIASPWYIKNAVVMRNPVYPYLFRDFPHSRYWSADRAKPYEEEQKGFGYAHSLTEPASSLQNLILTPWRLLTNPGVYTNTGDFTFTSWIGGLYAAFVLALVLQRRIPRSIPDLLTISGLMLLSWFYVAQHSRYLLPALPLLSVIGGYSAVRILQRTSRGERESALAGVLKYLTYSALLGQCLLVFWGLFALPVGGKEAREALATGMAPTALSVPDTVTALLQSNQVDLLKRRLDNFSALDWINRNTSASAGVILYEDVHGYYLDRPYLWGNREHSSYIPYDGMQKGDQLSRWLWDQGIRYVLINLNGSPDNEPTRRQETGLLGGPNGNELQALQLWYIEKSYASKDWRRLLSEAMKRGLWTPVFAEHGVVVLVISADNAEGVQHKGVAL